MDIQDEEKQEIEFFTTRESMIHGARDATHRGVVSRDAV